MIFFNHGMLLLGSNHFLINMFFFVVLKSRLVYRSQPKLIQPTSVQSGVPERNSHVFNLSNCSVVLATLLRSIVVVKAMHVGVLRGEHFFNILQGDINSNFPLGEYYQSRSPLFHSKPPAAFKIVANKRGLSNIIWLGEQRKASHAKNKHWYTKLQY